MTEPILKFTSTGTVIVNQQAYLAILNYHRHRLLDQLIREATARDTDTVNTTGDIIQ